ncbi:MAG: fumarate hydratase [Deltaproteobacteria bacterium]|jgi:fumarate hydratase subunit alpha|nr:fumarate hydratase [Deltaproteobacteria bacterium]
MRRIDTEELKAAVKALFLETAFRLPRRVEYDLAGALAAEESPQARDVLSILCENMRAARDGRIPLCQDTGLPQILLECGQEILWTGATPQEACEAGAREAYREGGLRCSGCLPLTRANLGYDLPVSVETRLVAGDSVTVYTLAKGGGCDNKSLLVNLPPTSGEAEAARAAAAAAVAAGPDACPPFYLGVCVGGSFESAPRHARRALWDILWGPPPTPEEESIAAAVKGILDASGLGPGCVGGRTTVLGLRVVAVPTHIASLPVAVNLCCHSFRPGRAIL